MKIKNFIATLLISTLCWTVFLTTMFTMFPIQGSENNDININDDVKIAYLATCKIEIGDYVSTGVLLNTGYVITAAHCVDVNIDGYISGDEKKPKIIFYGSNKSEHDGETIYAGFPPRFDIAIIKLDNPPESSVTLTETKFGDSLFTIGMTLAEDPNISIGRSSSYASGHARASIAAWRGNSGGGIWTTDQKLAGVASKIGIASTESNIRIPAPLNGGIVMLYGRATALSPLANWLRYSDTNEIMAGLDKRGLSFTYKLIEPESKLPMYNIYASLLFNVLGVLLCVSFFRKHLFS